MPIPLPRKKKFDPAQGSFPGFNTGGSESLPSGGPVGPSVPAGAPLTTPVAPGTRPDATSAYDAAAAELNPPKPAPGSGGLTWGPGTSTTPMGNYSPTSGPKSSAMRMLGGTPLAKMGPWGAAADVGIRGARAAFKPNPYTNPDTWRARNSSSEGQDLWMGRGTDKQGLYQLQTAKKYIGKGGQQEAHSYVGEYKETYGGGAGGFAHPGDEGHPMGSMSPGMAAAPQGLAPPGPALDYVHMSRTSGSGGPFFTAHESATNGFNTGNVEPIRAPQDD